MPSTSYPAARELTGHRVNGLNERLRVFALEVPGAEGREYVMLQPLPSNDHRVDPSAGIILHDPAERVLTYALPVGRDQDGPLNFFLHLSMRDNTASLWTEAAYETADDPVLDQSDFSYTRLTFQNGPIKERGINGISQEAIIAILIDRLEIFQLGQYACHDNQVALDHLQGARLWLHKRTVDRIARNVEGTRLA